MRAMRAKQTSRRHDGGLRRNRRKYRSHYMLPDSSLLMRPTCGLRASRYALSNG